MRRSTLVSALSALSLTLTRKPPFIVVDDRTNITTPRGNWGVDLQAGSQFGYKLLFVVLVSGLFAVYMQVSISPLYRQPRKC